MKAKNDADEFLTTSLMFAMDVSRTDLDTNRAGKISAAQGRKMQYEQAKGALGYWLGALWGFLLLIVKNDKPSYRDLPPEFAVAVIVISLGMAFWQQYQTGQALKENKVNVVTTAIKKMAQTQNRSRLYPISAGSMTFMINTATFDLLEDGAFYTLYYAPQTGTLLSIEAPLEDGKEKRLSNESIQDKVEDKGEEKEKSYREMFLS